MDHYLSGRIMEQEGHPTLPPYDRPSSESSDGYCNISVSSRVEINVHLPPTNRAPIASLLLSIPYWGPPQATHGYTPPPTPKQHFTLKKLEVDFSLLDFTFKFRCRSFLVPNHSFRRWYHLAPRLASSPWATSSTFLPPSLFVVLRVPFSTVNSIPIRLLWIT